MAYEVTESRLWEARRLSSILLARLDSFLLRGKGWSIGGYVQMATEVAGEHPG
jgi:hypothetical protein